ncbi:hbrB-like domain-containing protein [Sarocladium implicatum]|nr:hbrB-like domain-containing protein [Sarocladium implicatum]
MQPPPRSQARAPGSFSPLPGAAQGAPPPLSRPPPPRRVESSDSDDSSMMAPPPPINVNKARQARDGSPVTPIYTQFTNGSSASLQSSHNFSRPGGGGTPVRSAAASSPLLKGHSRKHSATQGSFEPTLPSMSTSNLSQVSGPAASLTASQIAAQAAIMSHQNSQQQQQQQRDHHLHHQHSYQQQQYQNNQQQQQQQQHARQRSQTVPFPGDAHEGARRGSAGKGPVSPPTLSLTEASAPRESAFGHGGWHGSSGNQQSERPGGGSHSLAATAAANVVFPRSGHSSPREPSVSPQPFPSMPPPPPPVPEKQSRSEKAKAKLFSRPGKISTKNESKEKPLPSPGKIGSALSALQRGNFSTSSLLDTGSPSMYSMNNSSSATIRAVETPTEDRGKEKERKHHFLSRQKHKLKDEYHLPLSSAASNSLPTDPNAPSSLYNFNVPSSPGPNSSGFVKAKKEKRLAERSESRLDNESTLGSQSDWPGPSSLPSLSQQSSYMHDPVDPTKLGLHNHMTLEDAWPYLKAKLLVIFEGEDLRLPVEDFNRVVQMHIKYCIHKRSPNSMLEDLREFLAAGFSSQDRTLRNTSEDRFIPTLVELWLFTFTSILPYVQAVFLPLDLEVSGCGTIMTPEQSRDFWGGVISTSTNSKQGRVAPAAAVLDVRRLVLVAYRDIVILPRYDTLKTIFSRLSLEFLPSSLANTALASPPPEAAAFSTSPPDSFSMVRPGTAMSLDPSVASYNSTSSTLLGEGSAGGRSRAISNVSFGSHGSDNALRPFTSGSASGGGHQQQPVLGSVREQNVEDSKQVTDMVGRMLQCMSVLSSLGDGVSDDEGGNNNARMEELCGQLFI